MTIQFNVNNLKLSHMDQGSLDDVGKQLNDVFYSAPIKKELAETNLGLTLEFSEIGQVIFTMYDYIEDIIGTASSDMNRTALEPVKADIFTVKKCTTIRFQWS